MAVSLDNLTPATPLDVFRRVFGWNPRHFWGMAGTGKAKITAKCGGLLREYGWQDSDAAARAGIRAALATAEDNLARWLRYRVAPAYAEATLPYPRLGDLRFQRAWPVAPGGRRLAIHLPEGEIRALGVAAHTTIGDVPLVGPFPYVGASPAAPYLIYRDRDGDGLVDQFEAAIATDLTDSTEIGVYVAEADRWDGSDLSERWRLLPARVRIAGGAVSITGAAWLGVRPVLYAGEDGDPLNGLAPETQANYLQALTVARRTTDASGTTVTTAPVVLTWEAGPCPSWCGPDRRVVGCATITDATNGLIAPASIYDPGYGWCDCPVSWDGYGCSTPDQVTVRYLAGLPLASDGATTEPWATTVARLAAADLARPVCSCKDANGQIDYWQRDLSQTGARDDLFQTPADAGNPFGARWGQIYAWRQVREAQQTPGISQ